MKNEPSWWTDSKGGEWERAKEALKRDWEQTKHDLGLGGHELNQKLGDTLEQAAGHVAMPPTDRANPPRVVGTWEEVEIPIGFGYAARSHYGDRYPKWDSGLESQLRNDWKNESVRFDDVKLYVRHGYEMRH